MPCRFVHLPLKPEMTQYAVFRGCFNDFIRVHCLLIHLKWIHHFRSVRNINSCLESRQIIDTHLQYLQRFATSSSESICSHHWRHKCTWKLVLCANIRSAAWRLHHDCPGGCYCLGLAGNSAGLMNANVSAGLLAIQTFCRFKNFWVKRTEMSRSQILMQVNSRLGADAEGVGRARVDV